MVAPYSQYDLALLDILNEAVAARPDPVAVWVGNVLAYESREELGQEFPGLGLVFQTPVVAVGEGGSVRAVAWGKKGRDLVAPEVGLSAEELGRRVVAAVDRAVGGGTAAQAVS